MYYEEAIVRTYIRKSKNKEVPYNQVHLGTDSKFNSNPEEPDEVAVILLEDLQELLKNYNPDELQEEKIQLENKIEELNSSAVSLASDVNKLKNDKIQLQEELLTYKKSVEDKSEEIIKLNNKLTEEKEESKGLLATITNLTSKIGILEKENVFLKSRNLIDRIRNKQYTEEETVPEIVEAEKKE